MNLTPTQAALLRRGLDHLLDHPDHVLESDFRRVVWVLARMATQSLVDEAAVTGSFDATSAAIASDLAMEAEPPPEHITLAEASRLYGIPPSTLRYHAARGSFEAQKIGKTWLADSHDLAAWVSERSE